MAVHLLFNARAAAGKAELQASLLCPLAYLCNAVLRTTDLEPQARAIQRHSSLPASLVHVLAAGLDTLAAVLPLPEERRPAAYAHFKWSMAVQVSGALCSGSLSSALGAYLRAAAEGSTDGGCGLRLLRSTTQLLEHAAGLQQPGACTTLTEQLSVILAVICPQLGRQVQEGHQRCRQPAELTSLWEQQQHRQLAMQLIRALPHLSAPLQRASAASTADAGSGYSGGDWQAGPAARQPGTPGSASSAGSLGDNAVPRLLLGWKQAAGLLDLLLTNPEGAPPDTLPPCALPGTVPVSTVPELEACRDAARAVLQPLPALLQQAQHNQYLQSYDTDTWARNNAVGVAQLASRLTVCAQPLCQQAGMQQPAGQDGNTAGLPAAASRVLWELHSMGCRHVHWALSNWSGGSARPAPLDPEHRLALASSITTSMTSASMLHRSLQSHGGASSNMDRWVCTQQPAFACPACQAPMGPFCALFVVVAATTFRMIPPLPSRCACDKPVFSLLLCSLFVLNTLFQATGCHGCRSCGGTARAGKQCGQR